VARDGKAEAGGNRCRRMRRTETVVDAFAALGEPGESSALPERANAIAAAGDDLVRIGLMADVPDQLVARRIEDVMNRDGQFNNTEPGAKMAAAHRHRGDRLLAKFVRNLTQ